jgi:hypothetical protein
MPALFCKNDDILWGEFIHFKVTQYVFISVVDLGFTPPSRNVLHSFRQVGVRHLSLKTERDAAKIMEEVPHLNDSKSF